MNISNTIKKGSVIVNADKQEIEVLYACKNFIQYWYKGFSTKFVRPMKDVETLFRVNHWMLSPM